MLQDATTSDIGRETNMTQYATTEEKFECMECGILCTRREMPLRYVPERKRDIEHCPNCGKRSTFLKGYVADMSLMT